MKKLSKLRKYAELFRKNIAMFLAPRITIMTIIHPIDQDGAVFEFFLTRGDAKSDQVSISKTQRTIGEALSKIPQKIVGGNLNGIRFAGTNIYLEGNRIIVIKGDDDSIKLTGSAVINDVKRVVSTSMGSKTP